MVSIIFTSYNHEKYLRQSIDSVLSQTYQDFELIIWDDASLDDSWEIITEYSDPRMKIFRNQENQRAMCNINKAIVDVASGEYIARQNSDDVWEPDKLEKQIAFLAAHHEVGAVFTDVLVIDEEGAPFNHPEHFNFNIFAQPNRSRYEWLNYFFYQGNALCHPSVLIRKRCYDECGLYNINFAQLADFDMWVRLCLSWEIHVLPEKLVRFRVRDNEANASSNRPETRIRGTYEFYKLLSNYRKLTCFDDLVKVFPSAEKYYRKDETDMDFALAMVALEEKPFTFTQLFGMDLLLEVISDPVRSENIKRLYDFDYKSFIDLTAKHDVFSREEVSTLWGTVTERDRQIASLNQAVNEREGQLAGINQALAERDGQIASLGQAVHSLTETVAQRDAAVAERDGQIVALYHSTSWRITWPLRIIGHQLKRFRRVSGYV